MLGYVNQQSRISINEGDIQNSSVNVSQLIDILGIDISSTAVNGDAQNTRRSYEVFVSGSSGADSAAITSSLYQTVYDQDFTLQSSNELLDITVGLAEDSDEVTSTVTQTDSTGKKIFPNDTLMMREKINIYRQYAQYLLGNANSSFYTTYGSTEAADKIDAAVFFNIKRLFCRDAIKKETFAIKFNKKRNNDESGSMTSVGADPKIYSDSGSSTNHRITNHAGSVASIKDPDGNKIGLIFYERGIVVLDAARVFDYENFASEATLASAASEGDVLKIVTIGNTNWSEIGASDNPEVGDIFVLNSTTPTGNGTVNQGEDLIQGQIDSVNHNSGRIDFKHNLKNLFIKGSIDDIVDHICATRFSRDNTTSLAFQNKTIVNSTLIFCRAAPGQANYSSNPTYIKDDGSIRVVDDESENPFAYVTTIGLYNSNKELVAVAKTSRPIEKNPETDLSIRIRLDF